MCGAVHILSVSDDVHDGIEILLCNEGLDNIKKIEGVEIINGEGGY